VRTGAIRRTFVRLIAPVKSSAPTKPTPSFFTGRMPFLSSNQQCQSTERKTTGQEVCSKYNKYQRFLYISTKITQHLSTPVTQNKSSTVTVSEFIGWAQNDHHLHEHMLDALHTISQYCTRTESAAVSVHQRQWRI